MYHLNNPNSGDICAITLYTLNGGGEEFPHIQKKSIQKISRFSINGKQSTKNWVRGRVCEGRPHKMRCERTPILAHWRLSRRGGRRPEGVEQTSRLHSVFDIHITISCTLSLLCIYLHTMRMCGYKIVFFFFDFNSHVHPQCIQRHTNGHKETRRLHRLWLYI